MARVNKANFRTYRDGETVTASEFNKIKDIFPEAINHIEDTLRDGQRLVDIENVNKEQDERLDSHDEQQAQTDQHLEQLDTRCDEQDEVLANHESRITTATSENSRQDEVIHNINERLREVEDNNADIKIVTVFANNIQKVETFVASEGQQEFQLKKGHYIPGQNRIQMFVDGVQQTLDDGFMEINSATIRFTEPLKAGMKVTAHYFTEEASDDLTEIMETIKEGPAILEGLIQNGESRVNEFIQSGETTINGFLSEGEREVEELVTKGENAFDNLVQRAEQVKADSILVQPTKPKPSDNCDIWFDTSEDDFLTLQDYEEARNQAFNNQMATFESRFSEIKGEKGDKGEPGVGVLESDFKDYMGDVHETLREVHKANVEYTVRTAVGEFNHLDYEGQHITANNSIEGHVKSAILKGNTLVNLFDVSNVKFYHQACYVGEDGYMVLPVVNKAYNHIIIPKEKCSMFKPSTKYTLWVHMLENHTEENGDGTTEQPGSFWLQSYDYSNTIVKTSNQGFYGCYFENNEIGVKSCVFETHDLETWADKSNGIQFDLPCYYAKTGGIQKLAIVILEGEYSIDELPFNATFEGMKSVKMPVLKATGKNLFDANKSIIESSNSYGYFDFSQYDSLTLSIIDKNPTMQLKGDEFLGFTYQGYNYEGTSSGWVMSNGSLWATEKISNRDKFLSFYPKNKETLDRILSKFDIQIELGSQATSYEPHKSNILTTSEEVELRGIGDVKDELNLLTGELTQRVGETLVTGGYWHFNGAQSQPSARFSYNKRVLTGANTPNRSIISDKIPTLPSDASFEKESYGLGGLHEDMLYLYIPRSWIGLDINDNDTVSANAKIKAYMDNLGEVRVQYQLATESVKTVDLSDNVVYSYDEVTHYDGSSEDGSLVPTVAVKVPTDVQAVITDQSATIQTLEQENQTLKKTQDTLLVVQLGMMEQMATNLSESEEQPTYLKALRQLASERGLL